MDKLLERLSQTGRWVTVLIGIVVYVCGWMLTVAYLKDYNDEWWAKIFSIFWISVHVLGLIIFLIWSWMY